MTTSPATSIQTQHREDGNEMDYSTAFWDRNAEKYSKRPIKNMPAYEHTMERVRSYLKPTDRVLEVGCGTASTALLLSPRVKHITASDFSSTMIEIGRAKAKKSGTGNIDFVVGTPFSKIFEPGTYDAVMGFSFLHLVEDLPGTLKRLRDLLKPDGLLISKTVCIADQTRLWGIPIAVMRFFGYAPYVSLLTADELEPAVTNAGFEILEAENHSVSPPSRFIVAKKV